MRRRLDTIHSFRTLLLFGGLFNILFASPLMFPGFADNYLYFLSYMNGLMHLGGHPYVRTVNPAHSLLVNVAGIDLVLIGSMVIYAAFDPDKRKGIVLLNVIGRLVFAALAAYYVFALSLMPLVLAPAVVDIGFCIGFLGFLVVLQKRDQGW